MLDARTLDVVVLVAYVAALFGFGIYAYLRVETVSEYFEGGRRWRAWLVALAVASTNLGAANTVGAVALAYREGVSALWYVTLQALAFVPFAFLAVPKVYPLHARTLAEFLEDRYRPWLRPVAATALALSTFAVMPAQIVGGASVVSTLTGMDPRTGYFCIGLALMFYTSLGGFLSVVYSDLLQWTLLVLGFVVGVPMVLAHVGGIETLARSLPESHRSLWTGARGGWGFLTILAWSLTVVIARFGSQEWYQRARAARSAADARRGIACGGLMAAPFGVLTMIVGVSALVLFPSLPNPEQAFAETMISSVPAGLRVLVLGAILAAVMSNGESSVNAATALFVNDICRPWLGERSERFFLRLSQVSTFALGSAALALALLSPAIVEYIRLGFLIRTPVAIVVLAGLYLALPTATGAVAAIALGTGSVLAWQFLGEPGRVDPFWIGAPVTILTLLLVSSATPRAPGSRRTRPA